MSILRKLWYGQYPLGTAFWGFYVGGYALVSLACFALFSLSGGAASVRFLSVLVQTAYLFVASVGVWNSSEQAVSQLQAWAARICVIVFGLSVAAVIFLAH